MSTKKSTLTIAILALIILGTISCGGEAPRPPISPRQFAALRWEEVVRQARGTTVNFGMWSGDEARNRYFQTRVAETLLREYGITLRVVPAGDIAELVNKLLNEKIAGKAAGGGIDMIWVNGENFRTARQGAILWGPFSERLPNIRLYDPASRLRDFGTPIEGYEAPWQRAQFVMAYDSARVAEPPLTIASLEAWIRSHPGRFTYIAPPDFTGSVFLRHLLLHYGGGAERFTEGFDEALSVKAMTAMVEFLNGIKPYLWRKGETYPATPREADRLFVNNEIDFTMSYGPSFASERIARGEYPATVRTFVFEEGTIGNYSFLAIPFNASNVPGALVVINHLMSHGAALEQAEALGSLYPHRLESLSPEQKAAVDALPRGPATLPLDELARRRLPEPDARYLERLEKDWMKKVLP